MESRNTTPSDEAGTFGFMTPVAKAEPKPRIVSEKDRAAAKERSRLARESNRARGEVQITIYLATALTEQIDVLKIRNDLPNRSQVFKLLLERLMANPAIIQELGL